MLKLDIIFSETANRLGNFIFTDADVTYQSSSYLVRTNFV